MLREKILSAREWVEDNLRTFFGKISPERRVLIIITLFLMFAALSLFITFSSIYRFGRGEGMNMQMQHIEVLNMELREKQQKIDSLKQIHNSENGNKCKTE